MAIDNDSLCISFIDNGETRGGFTYSVVNALIQLRSEINISHLLRWSGSSIVMNRYKILLDFVNNTDADWLLCLDSDILFTPDDLLRLWDLKSFDKQVVTGVYFLISGITPVVPSVLPSIYTLSGFESDGEATCIHPLPKNQILEVSRAGFGFLLLSRNVVSMVLGSDNENPFSERKANKSNVVGEDFMFFEKLESLGIKAYCDTELVVGHEKSIGINRHYYDFYWNLVDPRLGTS